MQKDGLGSHYPGGHLEGEGHKIRKIRRQLSDGGRGRVSPSCYPAWLTPAP